MPIKDLAKRKEYERLRNLKRRKGVPNRGPKRTPEEQKKFLAEQARKWRLRGDKTLTGYLVRKYNGMKHRVSGGLARSSLKTTGKAHGGSYEGLALLSASEFRRWALNHTDYLKLHKEWVESGCLLAKAPTVDRIDGKIGYVIENMRWLTFLENTRLGRMSRRGPTGYRGVSRGKREKRWRSSIVKDGKQFIIGSFDTVEEAARAYDRWARVVYGRAINFPDSDES